MKHNRSRVAVLVLFLLFSVSPVAVGASRKDRDNISGPGERIIRIAKKVKLFVRGLVSQDEWTPPLPKP